MCEKVGIRPRQPQAWHGSGGKAGAGRPGWNDDTGAGSPAPGCAPI